MPEVRTQQITPERLEALSKRVNTTNTLLSLNKVTRSLDGIASMLFEKVWSVALPTSLTKNLNYDFRLAFL